jgi:hypothetical protein
MDEVIAGSKIVAPNSPEDGVAVAPFDHIEMSGF